MNKIEFNKNAITINGTDIIFENNIYQIEEDNNKIYVLLDIPPKEKLLYNDVHNIYCYSKKGDKLWQIGNRDRSDDAVYTMIRIVDSELYANDFLGRRYKIDKDSGEIEDMVVVK